MKMKKLFFLVLLGFIWSSSSQALSVWVVESGNDPLSNSKNTLGITTVGISTLDLYYDVEGDTSYGYNFLLDITGVGSISNVGGGDSDIGNLDGDTYKQTGGDPINGTTSSATLGFTFDFNAEDMASLLISGTFTDSNFTNTAITSSTLARVSTVPVPAAVWLFGTAIIGMMGLNRRTIK